MTNPEPTCSVSILGSWHDVFFIEEMVRHLIRSVKAPTTDRILIVDSAPGPRNIDDERQKLLLATATKLVEEGVLTSVYQLRKAPEEWHLKHFGRIVSHERDYRGIPLFGWVAGLELSDARYHIHFDSDILIHQSESVSWIGQGIDLIEKDPEVLFVAPHPGPQTGTPSKLQGQSVAYESRQDGYYFKTFSSRRFLVNRDRLHNLLPLDVFHTSTKARIKAFFTGKPTVQNWETMMSHRLEKSDKYRVHLSSPGQWSLHAPDHSDAFVRAVPKIVQAVETGGFPKEQAGHYDLNLDYWTKNIYK